MVSITIGQYASQVASENGILRVSQDPSIYLGRAKGITVIEIYVRYE